MDIQSTNKFGLPMYFSSTRQLSCTESEYEVLFESINDIITFLSVCLIPVTLISNFIIIATAVLVPNSAFLQTSNSSMIITYLAIADFLVGFLVLPVFVLNRVNETREITGLSFLDETRKITESINPITCVFFHFAFVVPRYFSWAFLTLLCLERFLAVNFTFWYTRKVTRLKLKIAVALVIILAVAIHITDDWCEMIEPELTHKVVYYCISVLFVVAFVMCLQVLWVVLKKKREIRALSVGPTSSTSFSVSSSRSQQVSLRYAKITVYVMFLFFILWTPRMLFITIGDSIGNKCLKEIFYVISLFFQLVNSSVNAFVYAYVRESHRVAYKYLLTNPPCRWANVADAVRDVVFRSTLPTPYTRRSPHHRRVSPDKIVVFAADKIPTKSGPSSFTEAFYSCTMDNNSNKNGTSNH